MPITGDTSALSMDVRPSTASENSSLGRDAAPKGFTSEREGEDAPSGDLWPAWWGADVRGRGTSRRPETRHGTGRGESA
jgi:hypothetical protein